MRGYRSAVSRRLPTRSAIGVFAALPLFHLIERHVLAAERLHGDDTTVPILAKGKCTVTGHIWSYVRDDRPFAGPAPPAAVYYASRDRRGEHPVSSIWPPSPASFRPIAITASRRCSTRAKQAPDHAGSCFAHAGGSSSSWPISRRMPGRKKGERGLSDRAGGGQTPRRAVRHRARHQWAQCRRAARRAPGEEQAASGRLTPGCCASDETLALAPGS